LRSAGPVDAFALSSFAPIPGQRAVGLCVCTVKKIHQKDHEHGKKEPLMQSETVPVQLSTNRL
jgi:hypothetical protein